MIWIKVFKNHNFIELKSYDQERILVGSSKAVQVLLKDDKISPICCILEKEDNGEYFSHNMSDDTRKAIKDEDQIQFADYLLTFHYSLPETTSVTSVEQVLDRTVRTEILTEELLKQAASSKEAEVTELTEPAKKEVTLKPQQVSDPEVKVESAPSPKPTSSVPRVLRAKSTFAPQSSFKHSDEIIQSKKGNHLEIILCWKERVLDTFRFSEKRKISIGSDEKNDIVLNSLSFGKSFNIAQFSESRSQVYFPESLTGAFYVGKSKLAFRDYVAEKNPTKKGSSYQLNVMSSEMVRMDLEDNLSLYVNYNHSRKPQMINSLLTKKETSALVYSFLFVFGFWLFSEFHNLIKEEEKEEVKIRKAVIDFPKFKRQRLQIAKEAPTQIAQTTASSKKQSKKAGLKRKEGKMGGVRGAKKTKKSRVAVARKKGGAVKTGKSGSNLKSAKKDPNQIGLLGVFGSKGVQNELKESYTGSGELAGLAEEATGYTGSKVSRPGTGLGTNLRGSTGLGKGKSTVGKTNVTTKGKGTGQYGYGTGSLGDKTSSEISFGGEESSFSGNIDRGEIYRVIQSHKREVRYCYEKGLSRNKALSGKVILDWVILQNGRVTQAQIASSSLSDAGVANCVLNRLKTWKFPELPPGEQARVTFPFVFLSTNH